MIGALLPESGSLSDLAPVQRAAVAAAPSRRERGRGVLGRPLRVVVADSGEDVTHA